MRVLWLSPWLRTLAGVQIEALQAVGVDAMLVTTGHHPESASRRGYEVFVDGRIRSPSSWRDLAAAYRRAAEFRPDVVVAEIVRDPRWRIFGALAPVVAVVHDDVPHDDADRPAGWRRRAERAWLRRSKGVVVHSDYVGRRLAERESVSARLVPLTSDYPEHLVPRSRAAGPRRDFVVLGRIRPYKNLPVILEAWRRHLESECYAGDRLLVIGEGDTPGLPRNVVRLTGSYRYDDVIGLLAGAKASIVHHRTATQSGVQVLAMQVGTYPIISTAGGLNEFSPPGDTGVDVDDAAGLAARIGEFADEDFASTMGRSARQHYRATFRSGLAAEAWLRELERVSATSVLRGARTGGGPLAEVAVRPRGQRTATDVLGRMRPAGVGVGALLARSLGGQILWRAAALPVALVSVGVVTHTISPALYGELTIAIALTALFGVTADLGVNSVVLRRANTDGDDLPTLVRLSLGMTFVYVVPVCGAFCLAGWTIYPSSTYPLLHQSLPAYAVGLFATCVASSLRPLYQQQMRLSRVAAAEFSVSVACLCGFGLAAWSGWPAVAVFYVQGLAPLVLLVVLVAGQRTVGLRPLWRWHGFAQLAKESLGIGAGSLIASMYLRVDMLILSLLVTQRVVGEYGLAYRIIGPLTVVSVYAGLTLYPHLARLRGSADRYASAYTRAVVVMVAIAVPVALGSCLVARRAVELVAGPEYGGAVEPLAILSISLIPTFVNALIGTALAIAGLGGRFIVMSSICLVSNIVGNVLLVPLYSASGAAAVQLGTELLTVVIAGWWLRRDLRVRLLLDGSWRILVAASVLGVLVVSVEPAGPLIWTVAVGALSYVGALWFLRFPRLVHWC